MKVMLTIVLGSYNFTEVKTLGKLRMRGTANSSAGLLVCVYSWSPAISSRRA